VEFGFVDWQVGQLGRVEELERMEIADVAAQADMSVEERDHPAADVPADLVLVAVLAGILDPGANQPDAGLAVRLNRADLRGEHEIAHEGEHVARLVRRRPKEVAGLGNFRLEPDDAAERAEPEAPVHMLVLAVGDLRASRISAEVVTDERADESLRARGPRG